MSKISTFECVILAGGKSHRMGKNKALLPFGKENLLEFQYRRMSEIFLKVFVSCKKNLDLKPLEILFGKSFKNRFLQEDSVLFSPLVGIINAFSFLESKGIFFISVDTPFISDETIRTICAIEGNYDIIYPKSCQKSHYLSALWMESCISSTRKALKIGNYKLGDLVANLKSFCLECEDKLEFANLNYPKDYQDALKRFRQQNG